MAATKWTSIIDETREKILVPEMIKQMFDSPTGADKDTLKRCFEHYATKGSRNGITLEMMHAFGADIVEYMCTNHPQMPKHELTMLPEGDDEKVSYLEPYPALDRCSFEWKLNQSQQLESLSAYDKELLGTAWGAGLFNHVRTKQTLF